MKPPREPPAQLRPPETPQNALIILQLEVTRLRRLTQAYDVQIKRLSAALLIETRDQVVGIMEIRQYIGEAHLVADEFENTIAGFTSMLDTRGVK